MKELSEYTDKELRQELYRRSKKKDKKKCFNCKNRIPYTKANIMARKGLLPFKYSSFGLGAICLKCKDMNGYHLRVFSHETSCNLFERKQ